MKNTNFFAMYIVVLASALILMYAIINLIIDTV